MTATSLENVCRAESFLVFATGTIETASFPLGHTTTEVFCRFTIVAGSNWKLVSGISTGISQAASPNDKSDEIVFNIPIECTYRSTSPFGWPQILVCLYGRNRWSEETNLGFCWGYLPTVGSKLNSSVQSMCILKNKSFMSEFLGRISSTKTELGMSKTLEALKSNQFLSMEKCGVLKLSLRTLCRGTSDLDRN